MDHSTTYYAAIKVYIHITHYLVRPSNKCLGFDKFELDPQRREASASWALSSSYRHCVEFCIHNLDYLAPNQVSQHVRLARNNIKLIESNLETSRRSFSSKWQ